MRGKWLVIAAGILIPGMSRILLINARCHTVFLSGLQAGIIFSWPRGLFALMVDGKAQITISIQEQIYVLNTLSLSKIIGSAISAYVVEKHGRLKALFLLSVLMLLSWVPNFIGSTFLWFCLSEFFQGFFLNAYTSVVPVIIGETIEADSRGAISSLMEVIRGCGKLLMSVIGTTNYTVYNGVPAVISLVMVILVLFLKETPYFCMLKHGANKARERIIWLRGHCSETDITRMEDRMQLLRPSFGFKDLFRKNTRKSLGIVVIFGLLSKFTGHDTISALVAVLLPKSSVSSTTAVLILSITGICGTTTAMLLIDRVGRKPLAFISFLGTGVSFFALAIWYYLDEKTSLRMDSTRWLPLVLFLLIELFANLCSVQIYHVLNGEMFSTEVSGRATALVNVVVAIGVTVSNQGFYTVKESLGMAWAMAMCSAFNAIGCICVVVFLLETTGKTLEDIQRDISKETPSS